MIGLNAFLDAFAQSRQRAGGPQFLALGWGVWAEVGMAVQAARQGVPVDARDSGHPWLGRIVCDKLRAASRPMVSPAAKLARPAASLMKSSGRLVGVFQRRTV